MARWSLFRPCFCAIILSSLKMRENSTKEGHGENNNFLNYASRLKAMFLVFKKKRDKSLEHFIFLKSDDQYCHCELLCVQALKECFPDAFICFWMFCDRTSVLSQALIKHLPLSQYIPSLRLSFLFYLHTVGSGCYFLLII